MHNKDVILSNVMESIVEEQVNYLYNIGRLSACDCELCRTDIMAMILNKIPPKYISTKIGSVYSKFSVLKNQATADIVRYATEAADIVSKNPRHE